MKRKVVWLVVTVWMLAALLLASCAPAVVKEEEKVSAPKEKEEVVVPKEVVAPEKEANMVKWTGTKRDGTVVEKMIEKPRYGGWHIRAITTQPNYFDDILAQAPAYIRATNEELIRYNPFMLPQGTGEITATVGWMTMPWFAAGSLAESFELPDPETLIFHVRKGVRWALDPTSEASRLMGGRQFTAADVVYGLIIQFTKGMGYYGNQGSYLVTPLDVAKSIYVSPTDPWAVVMKTEPYQNWVNLGRTDYFHMMPREVREKYGNMNDWRNVVGTGAFFLKEYVGASSLTYVRNPNYWGDDPFFPENRLPYLDGFKVLIIPDKSTQLAALRTGQIDLLTGVEAEDFEPLLKTNPELKSDSYLSSAPGIFMRNDTKPFDDIRVRRALIMAINHRELLDDYYGGKGNLFTHPVTPAPEFMDQYIPLEELPEHIQELYSHKPDKARQLLAEAGYPQGFKTEVLVASAPAERVELLQIIKEYWAKIGVDLKIDVRDSTVVAGMSQRKTYTQMYASGISQVGAHAGQPAYMRFERPAGVGNYSRIDDPWLEKRFAEVSKNVGLDPERGHLIGNRESIIYRLEKVWFIPLPEPYKYHAWQPWLKGFSGPQTDFSSGALGSTYYAWIDQDLKKAMRR